MNKLTLKVAALVAVFYTGWAHADELPQTAEYGTTYDSEGTTGEVRFVADNSLVVQIRNTSDFPTGTLHCGVEVQIGAEQVLIPVLALTR